MTDFKCKTDAEYQAEQRQRALDWERAVGKLAITFEADRGGGWPDQLVQCGTTPEHRLKYLRSLGFRVRERYEVDSGFPGVTEIHQYCTLYNGVNVDLTDGWVWAEVARHGR